MSQYAARPTQLSHRVARGNGGCCADIDPRVAQNRGLHCLPYSVDANLALRICRGQQSRGECVDRRAQFRGIVSVIEGTGGRVRSNTVCGRDAPYCAPAHWVVSAIPHCPCRKPQVGVSPSQIETCRSSPLRQLQSMPAQRVAGSSYTERCTT